MPEHMKVKMVVMYFSGAATFWLQSIDPEVAEGSWEDFCSIVCSRFDREQHGQLIR